MLPLAVANILALWASPVLAQAADPRTDQDIVVFGGGIIPEADLTELEGMGVAKVFTPGATTTELVDWVRGHGAVGRPISSVLEAVCPDFPYGQ